MHATAPVLAFLGNAGWSEGLVLAAVIGVLLGLRLRQAVHGR